MKLLGPSFAIGCMLVSVGPLAGCKSAKENGAAASDRAPAKAEGEAKVEPTLKHDRGIDPDQKRLTIGALNDESGPAAVIGKPYALGKRILVETVNAGGTSHLPNGWRVELVERDHGYDPEQAAKAYQEIADDVLFVATSFGTANTIALRPMLEKDRMVAFPTSSSSKMAEFELTPPPATPYDIEARRALAWAVEDAGGAAKVRAAIVHQADDYGEDALAGWRAAAQSHEVTIVSEQPVAPEPPDFAAVAIALKKSKANYVLLATLPSATGAVLASAAKLNIAPKWIGNTPSWINAFFNPDVLPPSVLETFHWVTGLPYWGEDVPGMKDFLAAWDKYKSEGAEPDFYTLVSYVQGLAALEAAKRAIEAGDATRDGYLRALHGLNGFEAGGLVQPLDFSKVPYVVSSQARILKPDLAGRSWTQVADFAMPGR